MNEIGKIIFNDGHIEDMIVTDVYEKENYKKISFESRGVHYIFIEELRHLPDSTWNVKSRAFGITDENGITKVCTDIDRIEFLNLHIFCMVYYGKNERIKVKTMSNFLKDMAKLGAETVVVTTGFVVALMLCSMGLGKIAEKKIEKRYPELKEELESK